jgi:hypothetical protein
MVFVKSTKTHGFGAPLQKPWFQRNSPQPWF